MVVVFDPGHGGMDPGARHNGVCEKTLNLVVARICREALRAADGLGIWPVLTRDDDTDMRLSKRGDLTEEWSADLVVSIHANAYGNSTAKGIQCFVLDGDNVGWRIGRAIAEAAPTRLRRRSDEPVVCTIPDPDKPAWTDRAANVIKVHRGIPTVLVEMGFLTNASDAAFLSSPSGRLETAEAILVGVEFAAHLHKAASGEDPTKRSG